MLRLWGQWLTKLFINILTTLFISILIFVGGYSVMTGEFPPKMSRIKSSFDALAQWRDLQTKISKKSLSKNDEALIKEMSESRRQQSKIADQILGNESVTEAESPEGSTGQTADAKETDRRLLQAERLIMQLQTRVENLSTDLETLKAKTATAAPVVNPGKVPVSAQNSGQTRK